MKSIKISLEARYRLKVENQQEALQPEGREKKTQPASYRMKAKFPVSMGYKVKKGKESPKFMKSCTLG